MKSFSSYKKGELFLNIDVENQIILNHHFYMKLSAVDKMEDHGFTLSNTTHKKCFMHGSVLFP